MNCATSFFAVDVMYLLYWQSSLHGVIYLMWYFFHIMIMRLMVSSSLSLVSSFIIICFVSNVVHLWYFVAYNEFCPPLVTGVQCSCIQSYLYTSFRSAY